MLLQLVLKFHWFFKQCYIIMTEYEEHNEMVENISSKNKGSKTNQYIVALVIDIIAFAHGTVIGWPSPTIPLLQSENSPIGADPITPDVASWIGSLKCIGALVAVPIFSYIGSRKSRKIAGYLIGAFLIPSWLLIIFASNEAMLYAARLFAGLSIGGATAVCPLYIAEISEDSVRGRLSSMIVIFLNAGILFAYVLGSSVSYHVMGWVCFVNSLLFLVAFIFVPESPKYLASVKRFEDAEKVLKWLRGKENPTISKEILKMTNEFKVSEVSGSGFPLKTLFSTKGNIKGLLIGVLLCANLQLSGLFAIQSYTVNIFQDAGSSLSPNTATVIVGVLQLLGNCAATILVDKSGRKILLIISNVISTICLAVLGWYFYMKQSSDVSNISWIPLACLSIYVVAIALGIGSLCLLLVSEIFSEEVKGLAITISLFSFWGLTFVVGRFFLPLSLALGLHTCYWIFACVCIGGAFFAYFVVPETKNRSLDSILRELNGQKEDKNNFIRSNYTPVPEKEAQSSV